MSDNNDNDINSDLLNERIRKYFELKEKYEERRIKLIKNKYNKLKEKGFSKKKNKINYSKYENTLYFMQ